MPWIQIIGYVGSALIAVSLTMSNILRLRWINLFGASTFAIYGLIVEAYPVLFLNTFIALIDIYYLQKIYRTKEIFSLVPIKDPASDYLTKFLDFHQRDIQKFFPDFNLSKVENPRIYFILRNLLPGGLFIYQECSPTMICIVLDYAIPAYRDNKNGQFIFYAQNKFLKEQGFSELSAVSSIEAHRKYLRRIGFRSDEGNPDLFLKHI